MIRVKQFANNCPGFDVQFRPFFEDQMLVDLQSICYMFKYGEFPVD
jgi:hypothetical protein